MESPAALLVAISFSGCVFPITYLDFVDTKMPAGSTVAMLQRIINSPQFEGGRETRVLPHGEMEPILTHDHKARRQLGKWQTRFYQESREHVERIDYWMTAGQQTGDCHCNSAGHQNKNDG
uniref:Putative secreted protein n=1 Tax=Amblyomma tuberculatum TaxID=48802 RepID=A0A6M2E5F3_9ACAR